MAASKQDFRDAMSRLGAAVNIVTTDGPGGKCGFTASAVCSVTDTPPTLLVCMNRASEQHEVFRSNMVLCVNVLAMHQHDLSSKFAGQQGVTMEERFATDRWTRLATGAPALCDAGVNIDCRIREVVERGTHSIFLAEVEYVRQGPVEGGGLIWFARDYHGVGEATAKRPQAIRVG